MYGVTLSRNTLIAAPDQIFLTIDTIRLQYRLTRIQKKLSFSYQQLGERGLSYLMDETALTSSEEIEKIYHQIEMIIEDEKRVLSEIEAIKTEVS